MKKAPGMAGKKFSEEAKRKISEAKKREWAAWRAEQEALREKTPAEGGGSTVYSTEASKQEGQ